MEYDIIVPLEESKIAMRELWKDTFDDTDSYLDIFFNNYFTPRLCRCAMRESSLAAMLLGVSYDFCSELGRLRGLYLCGLSTRSEYRKQGLMSRLIEDIIDDAEKSGEFDFVFLIPADDHLREYYKKFGFYDSSDIERMMVSREIYESLRRISSTPDYALCDDIRIISDTEELKDLMRSRCGNQESLLTICRKYESTYHRNPGDISITHTHSDWAILLEEKIESGGVLIMRTPGSNADATVMMIQEDGEVIQLGGKRSDMSKLLADIICKKCDDTQISSADIASAHVPIICRREKYGMVRFLPRFWQKSQGFENRIFESASTIPQKFAKMNFEEKSKILAQFFSRYLHFRLMLD
ncbi:MAG: GNAT family N-acetyltransferase [Muribaculaceae bacterium]|nr:GNAT family N-acetyltransferase [Muribaculaceae bacterium]